MYNFQAKLNQTKKIIVFIDYELLLFLFEYTKPKYLKNSITTQKRKIDKTNKNIFFWTKTPYNINLEYIL